MHSAKQTLPSALKKHSVKIRICRVPDNRHSANNNGRQSVWRLAHAAATCANVAECLPCGTRHRYFMPSVGLLPSAGTRQKWNVPCAEALPSAWGSALGKEFVCRVPVVWHSANNKALGIYAVSGSVYNRFTVDCFAFSNVHLIGACMQMTKCGRSVSCGYTQAGS